MTKFDIALSEALKELGLKKLIARLYQLANIVDNNMVGQTTEHWNNGGITKIVKTSEVK